METIYRGQSKCSLKVSLSLLLSIPAQGCAKHPGDEFPSPREFFSLHLSSYLTHNWAHSRKSLCYSVLCPSHFEIYEKTFGFSWNCRKGYYKVLCIKAGKMLAESPRTCSSPLPCPPSFSGLVGPPPHVPGACRPRPCTLWARPRVLPTLPLSSRRAGLQQRLPYPSPGGLLVIFGDRVSGLSERMTGLEGAIGTLLPFLGMAFEW